VLHCNKKSKNCVASECSPSQHLPEGWTCVTLGELLKTLSDYHANGSYVTLKNHVTLLDNPDYALMIRATNFEKRDFEINAKYITQDAYEFMEKSKLFGGEILIGKIGNAGKVYLMPDLGRPCSLAMNLFLLRCCTCISNKYVFYHLLSQESEAELRSNVKGVGNPSIDKASVRSVHIALPPLAEQKRIVEEVERRLSVVEELESLVTTNLQRATRLRQSILQKAFEGKLVV